MINKIIHETSRLKIMSALAALKAGEKVDFTYLKKLLEMSDGNLSVHLRVLEDNGYIEIDKTFIGRKPKTFYWLSTNGRAAFADYVKELERILFTDKNTK